MNLAPILMLLLFAKGGGGAPAAKPATQQVRGKSGRLYTVIRVPSRTKRFRVQFQQAKPPMFWEADFNGPKPVVASIRLNADSKMVDDVMAFPPSVWE